MIHVHNNPSNIVFNDYVYVFLRGWYMPTDSRMNLTGDRWLKLAALRTDMAGGRKNYICCNPNAALMSLATVSESGTVIKVGRAVPNTQLDETAFRIIREDAINVEQWERNNNEGWPFDNMFAQALVKKRYEAINGVGTAPFNDQVNNEAYNALAKSFKPKPCNCGKLKTIVR